MVRDFFYRLRQDLHTSGLALSKFSEASLLELVETVHGRFESRISNLERQRRETGSGTCSSEESANRAAESEASLLELVEAVNSRFESRISNLERQRRETRSGICSREA